MIWDIWGFLLISGFIERAKNHELEGRAGVYIEKAHYWAENLDVYLEDLDMIQQASIPLHKAEAASK